MFLLSKVTFDTKVSQVWCLYLILHCAVYLLKVKMTNTVYSVKCAKCIMQCTLKGGNWLVIYWQISKQPMFSVHIHSLQ